MKRIAALMIALTVIGYASSALALTPVFSKDPALYGAQLVQDGDKVGLILDVQLAQGFELEDMPSVKNTYGSDCPLTWPTALCLVYDDIKAHRIFAMGYYLLPLGNTNIMPIPFSCEVVKAATSTEGDKVRCTQVNKVSMGSYTLEQYKALLEYHYLWLVDAMDTATYKAFSIPLNTSSLLAKGIAASDVTDEEVEDTSDTGTEVEEECDIEDPALDCDSDGILNADDLCASEYGEGEDGCPISSADVGAGGTTTVSDGGGCSSIAPAAAPNASAFLMMALALMPLAIRRRK